MGSDEAIGGQAVGSDEARPVGRGAGSVLGQQVREQYLLEVARSS
jgi:hypothetical protein